MSDVDQLLSLIGTHNKLLRDVIEYVERTEAERDEARAAYRNLLESVKQISGCYPQMEKDLYLVSQAYKDKPEWRKDTT